MFEYFDGLTDKMHNIPIPYSGLFIFHTVEFFVVIGISSFFVPNLFYLLLGMIYHFLLDFIHIFLEKLVFSRPFSIIEHVYRVRKYKEHGYPFC